MKFGKILLTALVCGLFLLLLSAFAVAPETETVLPENLPLTGLEMSACALPEKHISSVPGRMASSESKSARAAGEWS